MPIVVAAERVEAEVVICSREAHPVDVGLRLASRSFQELLPQFGRRTE